MLCWLFCAMLSVSYYELNAWGLGSVLLMTSCSTGQAINFTAPPRGYNRSVLSSDTSLECNVGHRCMSERHGWTLTSCYITKESRLLITCRKSFRGISADLLQGLDMTVNFHPFPHVIPFQPNIQPLHKLPNMLFFFGIIIDVSNLSVWRSFPHSSRANVSIIMLPDD